MATVGFLSSIAPIGKPCTFVRVLIFLEEILIIPYYFFFKSLP